MGCTRGNERERDKEKERNCFVYVYMKELRLLVDKKNAERKSKKNKISACSDYSISERIPCNHDEIFTESMESPLKV